MAILSRINRLHIIAAGGVVFVGLLVAFALTFLQPTMQGLKDLRGRQEQERTTWLGLPAAITALGQAQQTLAQSKADTDRFAATFPKMNVSDPFEAMFDLHRANTYEIGQPMYRFMISRGFEVRGLSIPDSPMQPVQVPPMWTYSFSSGVRAKNFPALLKALEPLEYDPSPGYVPFPTMSSGFPSISGTSPNLYVPLQMTFYVLSPRAFSPEAAAAAVVPAAPAPGLPPPPPSGVITRPSFAPEEE